MDNFHKERILHYTKIFVLRVSLLINPLRIKKITHSITVFRNFS